MSIALALLATGCSDDGGEGPIERAPHGDLAQSQRPPLDPDVPTTAQPPLSVDAKLSTVQMLEEDLAATPHPSDGGGRVELISAVSLDGPAESIRVGRPARFAVRYVAGPLGVAVGGTVFLQSSPFWDWSSPQTFRDDLPGYTEVSTSAEGVELEPLPGFESVMGVTIRGRALTEGEALDFVFGAGERGANVDRYVERRAEISIAVDGDGDGYRRLVPEGARVDVGPGPPAQLVVTGPTVVRPGETFTVHAAVLDAVGNSGLDVAGALGWSVLGSASAGQSVGGLPAATPLQAGDGTFASVEVTAPSEPGVLRIVAEGRADLDGLAGVSNPVVVHADAPRVLWADLHGHSQLSDGTGTPDDYFTYARRVARLDVSALTDHDHWGLRFLDADPDMWAGIRQVVTAHHAPGEFVTLLGYEWTSWLHGHRHVLYFDDDGPVLSSMDPAYQTPAQLWAGLRGRDALTFAHHSAGGPISTNWAYGADPVLEPVTEVASVHGSSEAADSPGRIYSPVEGNTVRDVLMAGLRLGFIGSGDSHDGHPGLSHLAAPARIGGLAALHAEAKTRPAVLAALRARSSYATNGGRIWLHVTLAGQPMGSTLPEGGDGAPDTQRLHIEVAGSGPIERVDLVRSGRIASLDAGSALEFTHDRELPRLAPGEFHYVRVVQHDGFVAWSSPIFAD